MARESSILFINNFAYVLTGNTCATGLKAFINGEIEITVEGAGKAGKIAAK